MCTWAVFDIPLALSQLFSGGFVANSRCVILCRHSQHRQPYDASVCEDTGGVATAWRGPIGDCLSTCFPRREFDGDPNEPHCRQPRARFKSWAHALRHMKMFKEKVADNTWHSGSLGQTVEKATKMFKKNSTRAHLLLPPSSPVPHGRCSTVVV